MSNSKPFKLALLPRVALEHTLRQFYLIDLVQITLCSKKMRRNLEAINTNILLVEIKLDPAETLVKLYFQNDVNYITFEWHLTTEEIDKKDVHLHCREPVGPLALGDLRLADNWKITAADKMFTVVKEEDRLETGKALLEFFLDTFHCSSKFFNLNLAALPKLERFLEWGQSRECESMDLLNGTEEDRIAVLNHVRITKRLHLRSKLPEGFVHETLLTVRWLFSNENSSMSKEVLMQRNCESTAIYNEVSIESSDMVEWLRKWMNGGYDKIRIYQFQIKSDAIDKFIDDLLDAFKWTKYDSNSTQQHFRDGSELYNLAYAYYLKRSDGKHLTMLTTDPGRIWFFVWRRVPSSEIPRGMREYKYVHYDKFRLLEPLLPTVFATDADVLKDLETY